MPLPELLRLPDYMTWLDLGLAACRAEGGAAELRADLAKLRG